jgi:transposase InsO family protein
MAASTIEKIWRKDTGIGLPKFDVGQELSQCSNCPFGKQTHSPFKNIEELPKNVGDIVSSDICGPFDMSIGGYKYFITWIDHATRYVQIDFLRNKECATVTDTFKKYITWLKKQRVADVKRIRTDNRGEYMGKEFTSLCNELRIIHETTAPHTPENNGIAERYNRMLQEGALTLHHDTELTHCFWVSGIHMMNFVKNCMLHTKIDKSLYEAFW